MALEQFGPYQLEALISRGGMGEVYRALDTVKDRIVALKRLPPDLAADVEFQARFRREAKVAAQLREAHIIPIHDYGEIEGRLFLDMRLVEGVDLAALLSRAGALPPPRAVQIVSQIAGALDAAHAAGLVHRDIKPANALIAHSDHDDNDFVYVADFGIARAMDETTDLTGTGKTVGTLAYMAPERFVAGRVDRRADVYSLACLLYETLTGTKPFPGDGAPAQMYAHVYLPPPAPTARQPGVPAGLDQVVACGMAKNPDDRYPTAGQLAAAARAALNGARPDRAPPAPARRWATWFYDVDAAAPGNPVTQAWPTPTDYVHAVQTTPDLASCDGLRGSEIVRDPLGLPSSSSGQNAIVFELNHPSGGVALRCFTRSPRDAAARYRALAPVLAASRCDVVAPARWIDSAITVNGQRWPAVVMPWVPGLPLNTVVEGLLDRPDELKRLAGSWVGALSELSAAELAHGDLQCGNILVDRTGELHLVDLDGFYVPSLTKPPAEFGHPDFQHPARSPRDWGPEMDGFSGLVIYLSLLALAVDPELWRFNSAENLVFTQNDYRHPGETPIWARLRDSGDAEVRRLTTLLAQYCASPAPPRLSDVFHQLDRSGRPAAPTVSAPPRETGKTVVPPTVGVEKWWADDVPEPVPETVPAARSGIGSRLSRNSITNGLMSGLIGAVLIIVIYGIVGQSIPAVARAALLVTLAGGLLTAALAGLPRATMGAWGSAVELAIGGAALGAGLSLGALGVFEFVVYQIGKDLTASALVPAWTLCALSIGAAAGILRGSGRAVVSGLLGGLVGGVAGGLIHVASGPTFTTTESEQTLDLDVLYLPTQVAIWLACTAIGLSIGVVDRARKRSWLTVIEGGLRGREVILDRREVRIGAAGTATLRLTGDQRVQPTHAVLTGDRGSYTLQCHGPVEVNGSAQTTSAPVALRNGDVLRVGGSFIRYEQRDTG